MRNLIQAEIYRYKHDHFFWVMLGASFLSGIVYGFSAFSGAFDDMFVVPLFAILAAFISLSIGREYGDGTIRNKVIAGKTKTVIFLSKLVISIAVSIIMVITFLIPCVAITAVNILSKIPLSILLWTLVGFFLLNIAWAVIFTVVSSLISLKEISGILNFILIIAIMFSSYQLEFLVGQPEYIVREEFANVILTAEEVEQVKDGTFQGSYSTNINDEGVVTYYKDVLTNDAKIPNPHYIPEPYRTILQSIDSVLPHGQINEYVSCLTANVYDDVPENAYPRIKIFPLYSLFLITVLSGTGLLLFRKKDLK